METPVKTIHHDLIEQSKRGDSAAQFELYELYHKAMYNTALRMTNNNAEAEDLMQEAFISAFDKLHTFSGKVNFGAWLKRIVINKCLDARKKQQIDTASLDENEKRLVDSPTDNTDYSFLNEKVDAIKQALYQLADGYRIVFSLYYLEGYDHEEIAEILNITPSASRSQLTRARQKIVEIVEKN